jgi:hypothetical protein
MCSKTLTRPNPEKHQEEEEFRGFKTSIMYISETEGVLWVAQPIH